MRAPMATQSADLGLGRIFASWLRLFEQPQLQLQFLLQLFHLLLVKSELLIGVAHSNMDVASHGPQMDYFTAAVQNAFSANRFTSLRSCTAADCHGKRRIK